MLKVAIVGNIASGKSTVEKIIEESGYKVFDTDKIAHSILASNNKIIDIFGTNDRKRIAKIVFSDSTKLKQLESIIHPEVKKELIKIFESNLDVVFISVPQLFEAKFDDLFDKIIYITADSNIRLERLMQRNNLTQEEALIRIKSQEELGKAERSDFVIENNSDYEFLKNHVKDVLSILI